jgi:RHS repeat-associated protein
MFHVKGYCPHPQIQVIWGFLFLIALVWGLGNSLSPSTHNDALGSPIAAADAAGSNKLWFTGKTQDASGLVYMGARYYHPALGRFLSRDPVNPNPKNPLSMNRYAYANDNPYRFVDPDGRSPVLAYFAANAALGGAIAGGLNIAGQWNNPGPINWQSVALSTLDGAEMGFYFGAFAGAQAGRVGIVNRAETASKGLGDVIRVTKSGVALPLGSKYQIPEGYVQNPHRSGSYGEIVEGKFKERLRIDPATPPGQKGPNYSHYHLDGKGEHYSPQPGDKNPGVKP